MRVVMVDKFPPLPADDGGKLRSAEVMRRLTGVGDVVLCCFERPGADEEAHRSLGVDLRTVPLRRTPASVLRGALHSGSGSAGRFWDPELAALVRQALVEPTDVLVVEHGQLAPYLDVGPAALKVLDLHNVDSELAASYGRSGRSLRARAARVEARLLRRLERRAIDRADVVVVVSEADAALLPARPRELLVCGNGWRCGESVAAPSNEPIVIFTALFAWRPNAEAATWFVRSVWPEVLRRQPDARLLLVGRDPIPEVRELAQPTVDVTGTVPEIRPFLERARVAIAPLLAGGGTRLKILEALDAGRPVVATSVGVAGLEDLIGCGVVVEDDPEKMAVVVASLLADEAEAIRLGEMGAAAVRSRYTWDETLAALVRRVSR